MKLQFKLIVFLLLAATLLSSFTGCAPQSRKVSEIKAGQDGNDASIANGNSDPLTSKRDTNTEEYTELAYMGKSTLQIVYCIDASDTIKSAINDLSAVFLQTAGAEIAVAHDSEAKATNHEIRIGKTKHAGLDGLKIYNEFSDLGVDDFVITHREGITYIYAKNDLSLQNAMRYFAEHTLCLDEKQHYVGIKQDYELIYRDPTENTVEYTGSDACYLYFTTHKGSMSETYVRLSFTGNKAWRIQTKQNESDAFNDIGASQRLSLSLNELPMLATYPITVTAENGTVTATEAGGSYVELTTSPFGLKFFTPEGALSQHITELKTNNAGSVITGDIQPGEAIFGTGERFDSVNQRGRKINMYTKDIWSRSDACYMVIPLLTFTRGSGVFLNIYEEMNLTLGTYGNEDAAEVWTGEIIRANVDCYVYTSDSMADSIYGYSKLSGFAEQPEEWTYGMILCRYSPDLSQKWTADISKTNYYNDGRGMGVYDTIALMEAYDLPWTGVLLEGWSYEKPEKQADLKELCEYIHSLGKKVMVYEAVGWLGSVQTGYVEKYQLTQTLPDGTVINLLPRTDSNNPDAAGGDDRPGRPYLDVTNPAAVEWYFGEYWEYISTELGVDGCKIDFCEEIPEYYQLNYYNKDYPTAGTHHWLPTAWCSMFGEMIMSKPDSGMNFTRGGGIGSQRAPYMWAGDQKRVYESLQFQLVAVMSSGMSGVPFMSYDMSGYQYGGGNGWGSGENDQPYGEAQVFLRGLQFTAFTINMQQHGKVRQAFDFANGVIMKEFVYYSETRGQWEYKSKKDADGNVIYAVDENGEKIPLKDSFGNIQTDKNGETLYQPEYEYLIKPGEMTYVTDIYRGYVKLHEYLTPYIDEYSQIACKTAMPVMRPLALMWQDDKNTYDINDEYMFGDAFLVAPVITEKYERDIYLPEGKWKDLNTGKIYVVDKEGLTLEGYKAELQELPVFYNMNTTSETAEELLSGIEEIFQYINSIDCTQFYEKTGKYPQ